MSEIAVLGAGQMGSAMVRRLLATGHRVTVWNRTPGRTAALAEAGAVLATTAERAMAGADLVITMLTDAGAVEAALFGSPTSGTGGAAVHTLRPGTGGARVHTLRPGTVVVQMSTISPDEVRRIADRLPVTVSLLDAPVGGSVDAVGAGSLTIFAGGPAAALDKVAPVLGNLGTIRRCGPVGAAAALKLVVNTAMLTALGALRDTLTVADALDVDRAVAFDVLAAGPLGGAVRRATATGASFANALAAKDVRLALRDVTTNVPVATAALQLLVAADPAADIATLVSTEPR